MAAVATILKDVIAELGSAENTPLRERYSPEDTGINMLSTLFTKATTAANEDVKPSMRPKPFEVKQSSILSSRLKDISDTVASIDKKLTTVINNQIAQPVTAVPSTANVKPEPATPTMVAATGTAANDPRTYIANSKLDDQYTDPREKSMFDNDLVKDPINVLREEMVSNFTKVFDLLEDQSNMLKNSVVDPVSNILPDMKTIGKMLPALGTTLLWVGGAAFAGAVGYGVGSMLEKKFGLGEAINDILDSLGLGGVDKEGIAKQRELATKDQKDELEKIGWKMIPGDKPGVYMYQDLASEKMYKFEDLSKEQQRAIVNAKSAAVRKQNEDAARMVGDPSREGGGRSTGGAAPFSETGAVGRPAADQTSYSPTGGVSISHDAAPLTGLTPATVGRAPPVGGATAPKKIANEAGKKAMINAMDKRGITDPTQRAAIMAQVAHESAGFSMLSENLNYSANRLQEIFSYYRFNPEEASLDAGVPYQIASKAYGNRMGNGPPSTGDGFEYRGRGFIQLTGKNNYQRFGISNPDSLLDPNRAAENALDYLLGYRGDWADTTSLTQYVNGGTNGLSDRMGYFNTFLQDPSITGGEGNDTLVGSGGDDWSPTVSAAGLPPATTPMTPPAAPSGGGGGPAPAPSSAAPAESAPAAPASSSSATTPSESNSEQMAWQIKLTEDSIKNLQADIDSGGMSERAESFAKEKLKKLQAQIPLLEQMRKAGVTEAQFKENQIVQPAAPKGPTIMESKDSLGDYSIAPKQAVNAESMDMGSKAIEAARATPPEPVVIAAPMPAPAAPTVAPAKSAPPTTELSARSTENAFMRSSIKDFAHPTQFASAAIV